MKEMAIFPRYTLISSSICNVQLLDIRMYSNRYCLNDPPTFSDVLFDSQISLGVYLLYSRFVDELNAKLFG